MKVCYARRCEPRSAVLSHCLLDATWPSKSENCSDVEDEDASKEVTISLGPHNVALQRAERCISIPVPNNTSEVAHERCGGNGTTLVSSKTGRIIEMIWKPIGYDRTLWFGKWLDPVAISLGISE
jgi:hypothetical protein